jgi:hypothetical protein
MPPEPLFSYPKRTSEEFLRNICLSHCTALWKGYHARYEIIDKKLYLLSIHGLDFSKEKGIYFPKKELRDIFPGHEGTKMFLDWYSGTLRIYSTVYKKNLNDNSKFTNDKITFTIENGIVKNVLKEDIEVKKNQYE